MITNNDIRQSEVILRGSRQAYMVIELYELSYPIPNLLVVGWLAVFIATSCAAAFIKSFVLPKEVSARVRCHGSRR